MQRYEKYTDKIVASQGKRRYSTLYYPKLKEKTTDRYIISKKSDRLDLLAYTHYNDQRLWWIIAKANRIGHGTLRIPAGIRLRIPYPLDVFDLDDQMKDTNQL